MSSVQYTKFTNVEYGESKGFVQSGTQIFHGYGECKFPNSRKSYTGFYQNGVQHGHGHSKYWNADQTLREEYIGDYEKGERHGSGMMISYPPLTGWPATVMVQYEGSWCKGKMNGSGVAIFSDGSRYEGYFKNGYYHGYGEWTRANESYKGGWKDGKKHGFGIMVQGHVIYEGGWKDGHKHGFGSMTQQGRVVEGGWRNDVMMSDGQRDPRAAYSAAHFP